MRLSKFIEGIQKDKKAHLILGIALNPIIFIASILFLNSYLLGFLGCLSFHAFIEIYQHITKTGRFEVLDFLAGSYSAIFIYIIIKIVSYEL